jgi:hypothetical protein
MAGQRGSRYSVYLLCWYKSTDTDAADDSQTTLDGRQRGSLARMREGQEGTGGGGGGVHALGGGIRVAGSPGASVGKILTVNELFRRQAKARRRLAVAVQAPFVLYYQLTDSIHAPSSARLDVRCSTEPSYICVVILLHVSSYCYICVLILQYASGGSTEPFRKAQQVF